MWSSPLAAALALAGAALAQSGVTTRVSVGSGGSEGNGVSTFGVLSADARYVAFSSSSDNLVPLDTNGATDVFVHDRQLGLTTLVSRASDGTLADADSSQPSISADGRYVAFETFAQNLDPSDANAWIDVYVHDRWTGTTLLVSRAIGGGAGNGESTDPSISADGRRIAFESAASDLVPNDSNACYDVFVAELPAGSITRASVSSAREQGATDSIDAWISADGACVVFASAADNLVPGDGNGQFDVFVRVLGAGTTEAASVSSAGAFGDGPCAYASSSSDGRYVAFSSLASNLVAQDTNSANDVFIRDRLLGTLARASLGTGGVEGDSGSSNPFLSWDGRFLAFRSYATNFAAQDLNSAPDVFWRDLELGLTRRVSVSTHDAEADGFNQAFALSADGRICAFHSFAPNLVSFDANLAGDVFVRDVLCDVPWCELGPGAGGAAGAPSLWVLGAAARGAHSQFHAQGTPPNAPGAWIYGTSVLALPIVDSVLWPAPELVLPCSADAAGAAQFALAWPFGVPSGLAVVAQAWFVDASASQGFSASAGLRCDFP